MIMVTFTLLRSSYILYPSYYLNLYLFIQLFIYLFVVSSWSLCAVRTGAAQVLYSY